MHRMILDGPGRVHWDEAPDPVLTSSEAAIVRPIAVATCDLDVGVLRGSYPLAGPYPFGHEAVAEVVETGDAVSTVQVGDRVVVPFQISCGRCRPCALGRTGNCARHPRLSTFGLGSMGGLEWGGLLASAALVPHADAMLVTLPSGVDPIAVASASDNLPDAWRAVGPQLAANPHGDVLVVGGAPASIGLYAAGLAVALGSASVAYVDDDPSRLATAEALGAEPVEGKRRRSGGYPIVVDASGTPDGLAFALNSTAFDGTCTSVSVYIQNPSIPMFAMYSRCCTLHTGRAHVRPAIPHVLQLVQQGRFRPSLVTSAVVSWAQAASALADPPTKLVLVNDDESSVASLDRS